MLKTTFTLMLNDNMVNIKDHIGFVVVCEFLCISLLFQGCTGLTEAQEGNSFSFVKIRLLKISRESATASCS